MEWSWPESRRQTVCTVDGRIGEVGLPKPIGVQKTSCEYLSEVSDMKHFTLLDLSFALLGLYLCPGSSFLD